MLNPPPVPPIPEELRDAISALLRSATIMRAVIVKAGEEEQDIVEVLAEHQDVVLLADVVIDLWRQALGHDLEDDELDED